MNWLKSNWRWGAFNLFAASVSLYVVSRGTTDWRNMDTFDSGLESGKWAIRFLLLSLSMSPLNTYFGWKSGIKLRKSAGLWAFGFACIHVLLYLREAALNWLTWPLPDFLVLGIVGMTILGVMAATSNRWSMKRLAKNWKRVHRRVYFAGMAVMAHSMLATQMSKKLMGRDPDAPHELKIYMAVLSVLLVVRIPIVRPLLQEIPALLKRFSKPKTAVNPADISDRNVELWPQVHGRESGVSIKPTFMIWNQILNQSSLNNMNQPGKENRLSESLASNPSDEALPEEETEIHQVDHKLLL